MHFLSLGVVLGLAVTALAATIPRSHAIHEKLDARASQRWSKRDRLFNKDRLSMRIGLKQRNLHLGHDLLMEVSDPDSPRYAKHWTSEEVVNMFAPEQSTVDLVRTWLIEAGVDPKTISHSDNKAWLAFDATAEDAESLLITEYHIYEHEDGHKTAACESYHVPKHIQKHIDYITPGINLLAPQKRDRGRQSPVADSKAFLKSSNVKKVSDSVQLDINDLATCNSSVHPACIRALYQFPEVPEYPGGKPRADNSLGIFEEGDFYVQEDLDLFFAHLASNIPAGTKPKPAFIDGAYAPVPGFIDYPGESDLDFELALPIIYPQNITLFQTDDLWYTYYYGSGGFLNTFLDAIDGSYCTYSAFGETGNAPFDPVYPDYNPDGYTGQLQCGVYKPTNVISVSYGYPEHLLPAYYQQRQCSEFMKLGLQGVSILFSSGDNGVAAREGECLGDYRTVFNPHFPASCPYVTTVGATKIASSVYDPEVVAFEDEFFGSGGGFSNVFPVAPYQHSAVYDYLNHHDPGYSYYRGNVSLDTTNGRYNRSGRGYPDVSANGDSIATYVDGYASLSYGTSASAPIFASLINRINEQRLNIGKSTLGFLNPVFYANKKLFNDITEGANGGCGTKGFPAAPGWDPSTGLGTPNYPKMVDYFLSLP